MDWLKRLFKKERRILQPIHHNAHVYAWKRKQQIDVMGKSWRGHPQHDPLEFPWQYEPWKLDRIEKARGIKH